MTPSFTQPRSILITGASSGIGAGLARRYAAPGVGLSLGGRDTARLEQVAEDCRVRGATVAVRAVAVEDAAAMTAWIAAAEDQRPLDLVIANAGISAGTGAGGESARQTREIFAVNIDGVANTLLPAIERMRARPREGRAWRGQLAIVSSLAGFRGFPGAPAYCASKAAVRVWGEALRGELATAGIGVSVICPGYVVSRMTAANDFPMPLLMETDKAVERVVKGLAANKARIAFPRRLAAVTWLLAALPPAWTDPILRRLPKKT